MNHACSPNVHVSYVDAPPPAQWAVFKSSSSSSTEAGQEPSHALELLATTVRDVAEGEELCFSYLGTADLSPEKRRNALLEYDIVLCSSDDEGEGEEEEGP